MKVVNISLWISLTVFSFLLHCCTPENNNTPNGTNLESCLFCHNDMTGFSDAHNPEAIGCSSCHLGDIKSNDKDISHHGMVKIPGNLSNVSKTCSSTQCHKSEFERIKNSLMSTNSGIVSIDKYVFEEIANTDTFMNIENIHHTAADRHLKNLCYKCHLGYEKKHYGAIDELSRGGGCLACHLNYNEHKLNISDNIHPAINLNTGNDKCFGCHSRSSRISTNYEGWYETILSKEDLKDSAIYRVLLDGRVFAKAEDDIHHKAGLACIDCHSSIDVMGDGHNYKHESDAVKIQCTDCHPKAKFNKVNIKKVGSIAAKDYILRKYKYPTEDFIITQKDSIPLVNTGFDHSGNPFLIGKFNQKLYHLNILPETCQKDKVHSNLDCNMCHTSWVTSCIGCHTEYDEKVKIKGKKERGKWYEKIGEFNKSLPVMGVNNQKGKIIEPAIPGMIMTLDKTKFNAQKFGHDSIFHRLFAPISAHTITDKPRDCKSCHNNPEALGYGKGKMKFDKQTGKWSFESLYENSKEDNLPQDAWIGFMSTVDKNTKYSAHQNFQPLSLESQKKILKVGSCIYCHFEEKILLKRMITGEYQNLTNECKYYKKIK